MNFEGDFRKICDVDVSALSRRIAALPESAWRNDVARRFEVHKHGAAVFLKNDIRSEHLYGTIHRDNYDAFAAEVEPILAAVRAALDRPGYWIRLQFARLPAGKAILPHTDWGLWSLANSVRMHLPIITNPEVRFRVGGDKRYMPPGEVCEINNMREHAAENFGASARIHMILDWARPIASALERLEYFMNLPDAHLLARPTLGENEEERYACRCEPSAAAPDAVCRGRIVSVQCSVRVGGRELYTSLDGFHDEFVSYLHGHRQLPPGMESALDGRRVGEVVSITLSPEMAYGPRVARAKTSVTPRELSAPVGSDPWVHPGSGTHAMLLRPTPVVDKIELDPNHPWAGETLDVTMKIVGVRELDADEVRHVFEGAALLDPSNAAERLASSLSAARPLRKA